MGVYEDIANLAGAMISGVLNRIVLAALILLIGFIMGRLAGKLVQRGLKEVAFSKLLRLSTLRLSLEDLLGGAVSMIFYGVSIVLALNQLGISRLLVSIISVAVIVILVASLFLSLGDMMPNLLAGIRIYTKRPLRKGDIIQYKDLKGRITDITLFETRIETENKDTIFIPNSNLLKEEVVKLKS